MTIIEAWKDSLVLCRPQAIKLMLLVTINAMKEAVRVLCVPWFLIPVGILIVLSLVVNSLGIPSLTYTLITATMILAVRPSVDIKNWDYFKKYWLKYGSFLMEIAFWGVGIIAALYLWLLMLTPFGYAFSLNPFKFFETGGFIDYVAAAPLLLLIIVLAPLGMFGFSEFMIFFY